MGSIVDARHAGTALAAQATTVKNSVTPAKIRGSAAVTPNSSEDKDRVRNNAAIRPPVIPSRTTRKLSDRMIRTMPPPVDVLQIAF